MSQHHAQCPSCGRTFKSLTKHLSQRDNKCSDLSLCRQILPAVDVPAIVSRRSKGAGEGDIDLLSSSGEDNVGPEENNIDDQSFTQLPHSDDDAPFPDADEHAYDDDDAYYDDDVSDMAAPPIFFVPDGWVKQRSGCSEVEAVAGVAGVVTTKTAPTASGYEAGDESIVESSSCRSRTNSSLFSMDSPPVSGSCAPDPPAPGLDITSNDVNRDSDSLTDEDMAILDLGKWRENLGGNVFERTDISYLRFHDYLSGLGCPLKTFDGALKLLRKEALENGLDLSKPQPSRASLLSRLKQQFGVGLDPHAVNVVLENSSPLDENYKREKKDEAVCFTFDAESSISSLLADEELFCNLDNLAVDPNNPFGRCPRNQPLGEVLTGSWYQEAYDNMLINHGIGGIAGDGIDKANNLPLFMMPIIIYLDKTGTSVMQRHGLEPVMVTTPILKEKIRNITKKSWRHLGFIPDMDQKSRASKQRERSTKKGKGRSCRNYHVCLEAVLKSFEELQKKGMKRFLTLGGETKEVSIKFPVAFFIGDTKSQDSLTCRVAHYKQIRTSYSCYCSFEDLCSTTQMCALVTQEEQHTLLQGCMEELNEADEQALFEALHDVSTQRCFSKAMFGLDYGGTKYGQFQACCLDPMHAYESGVLKMVCKGFVDPMFPACKERLDTFVDKIMSNQRSSESKNFPRSNFKKGITNATLLTSNEWAGLLMTYLIIAQTYQGEQILDARFEDNELRFQRRQAAAKKKASTKKAKESESRKGGFHKLPAPSTRRSNVSEEGVVTDSESVEDGLDSEGEARDPTTLADGPRCRSKDFVQLTEQLLSLHAYYSQTTTFWKEGDAEGELELDDAMKVVLLQLTKTLKRPGNGWNTAKTHSFFRHLARTMGQYGKPTNYDAEVGERGLKVWAKTHARRTNMGDTEAFTGQTSERIYEDLVFNRALQVVEKYSRRPGAHDPEDDDVSQTKPVGMEGNPKYIVTYEKKYTRCDGLVWHGAVGTWQGKRKHKGIVEIPAAVLDCIDNLFYSTGGDDDATPAALAKRIATKIVGYTEYIGNGGVRFRAHPNLGNKGPWYDWCILEDPNDNQDYTRLYYDSDDNSCLLDELPLEGPPFKNPATPARNSKSKTKGHQVSAKSNSRGRSSGIQPPRKKRKGRQPRAPKKEVKPPATVLSYCQRTHGTEDGPNHVPAKIIALFEKPGTNEPMALVHACRPWMQKNYNRTSAITESWHLQYWKEDDPEPPNRSDKKGRRPRQRLRSHYNLVSVDTIKERIYVVEETPGIHETLPVAEYSGHVVFVLDRKSVWPAKFLQKRLDGETVRTVNDSELDSDSEVDLSGDSD